MDCGARHPDLSLTCNLPSEENHQAHLGMTLFPRVDYSWPNLDYVAPPPPPGDPMAVMLGMVGRARRERHVKPLKL